MEPSAEDSLAKLFKVVQQRYSRYVNKKGNTHGVNWQGRFYSTPMDLPHLYEAIRYIELNPIKTKVTSDIATYPWTSARGRFTGNHYIMVDPVYKHLEIDDWAAYLNEGSDEEIVSNLIYNIERGLPSGDPIFVRLCKTIERFQKERSLD